MAIEGMIEVVVTTGGGRIRDSIKLTTEMRLAADPWKGLYGYIKEMIARKHNVDEENVWFRVHGKWAKGGMLYKFNKDTGEVECLGPINGITEKMVYNLG
jgi:hypothetical protein